jgi:hypothetical protein
MPTAELTPSPQNLLAALWQLLGLSSAGHPSPLTWAEAAPICMTLGLGRVTLTQDESSSLRWVLDCTGGWSQQQGQGSALRVVVKESSDHLSASLQQTDSVGHCYTLRPAPALDLAANGGDGGAATGWRADVAPEWAAAWAAGTLPPLQRALVPRIAGAGTMMMDAAVSEAQAAEAILHAPLDQTEVRRRAIGTATCACLATSTCLAVYSCLSSCLVVCLSFFQD